jgi:hydrogenase expression/formation protein HypD
MKFVNEFRDATALRRGLERLTRRVTRRWVIMDVCGGQTHSLLRHGIEAALEGVIELIHGPGCPVCVTPAETIDAAVELAKEENITLASFGDMLAVPGNVSSLLQARAAGGDIRAVYSPLDAVTLARRNPRRKVVFLAVGFETTIPATALAVLQARQWGLTNFRVLAHHVRVEPAMRAVLATAGNRVQGFLAAGHVCTVTGFQHYAAFVAEYQTPVVVTGFEPLDLLAGLDRCIELLERETPAVENCYARCVRPAGNETAQRLIDTVFEVADVPWRGLGRISAGGWKLRDEFRQFDAAEWLDDQFFNGRRVPAGQSGSRSDAAMSSVERCRSGDVLSGRLKPTACPHFGVACRPESPLGAPMVSSEGACAAYYRYTVSRETLSTSPRRTIEDQARSTCDADSIP